MRKEVREAIDRVYPNGRVDLCVDPDESYFCDVYPKLRGALSRIAQARILQEREAAGGPVWWDDSDPEEDPPDDQTNSRSYHLFFISPEGEAFRFETEFETLVESGFADEDGGEDEGDEDREPDLVVGSVGGHGRTGWVAAVSLAAPFAVIELGETIDFEDGGSAEMQIETCCETKDGKPVTLEEMFRASHDAHAYQTLLKLRAKIAAILEKRGIAVLTREEWREPVPSLRVAKNTHLTAGQGPLRVLDAFFFEEL